MLKVNKISKTDIKEGVAKAIFAVAAAFAIISVLTIIGYLLYASIPAFREIGLFNFLFGTVWNPDFDAPASDKFGILPMIVGSVLATGGALIIGGTLGILIAIFLVYFCPKKLKGALTQVISLLAGIPSIVYGYFGLNQIVPLLAKISPNDYGKGLLAVSLVLGIMILPTVASLAKDSLMSVPSNYYEGAVALGMTKSQAVFRIMVPTASSGIFTALGLGIGRAVGETMAVVMVAGNTAQFPKGLFDSFRTLTGNIVTGMSYASGTYLDALIATGFILLVFVLILNGILYAMRRDKTKREKKRGGRMTRYINADGVTGRATAFRSKKLGSEVLKYLSYTATAIMVLSIGYILIYVIVMGISAFTRLDALDFLFGKSTIIKPTLLPAFVSTGSIIGIALAIALPIGICAAIYLVEYSKTGSRLVKVIRLFTDTLSGIPSVVFGLFGSILFNTVFGLGYSLLSGGLTLSIMILPTIVRSVEESLLGVPLTYREASYALGSGKLHTISKVVLPCALRGILTAVILSVGRIVSESAALLFTSGSVATMPKNVLSSGATFAVLMYTFTSEGLHMDQAWATALVLIVLVLIINMLVLLVGRKEKKSV